MKKFYSLFILIAFLWSIPSHLSAQKDSRQTKKVRPKVGLVLSGGGAKGFAYIGLFKVLKEIGLHIDYVGGASIGSIMAGFYAAGYDPDTLPSIIRQINWDEVMQDKVERKYIPFIDKSMGNPLIIQLPLEKDKKVGISMKTSLFKGQNVEMLLSRYFAPFYKYKDFSQLPTPMFCTATDLLTGKSVVLKEGYLEKAIRASMSIPGYFEPVLYDGKYLVDGGVVNNYPVVDMKKLGMNYVIGGDVQQGLEKDINKLNNIFSVIGQIIAFSNLESTEQGLKNTDLYIHFDMGPYNMMSFNDYDSIIAIGERTARAHYDELKKLNDSLNAIEYVPGNSFNTRFVDSLNIMNVRIEGNNKVSPRFINNTFYKLKQKTITTDQLEDAIKYLYGSGFFDLVTYSFEEPNDQEKQEAKKNGFDNPVNLVINVKEKSLGTLAAGVHYDNDYNIGLLFNGYFRNLLFRGSKLLVNLNLSQNINLKFTYLVDRGPRAGFGFTGHIYSFNFNDFEGDVKVNELKFTNYKASLFVKSTIKNQFGLMGGVDYEYFRVTQNVMVDTLLEMFNDFNSYVTLFGEFKLDTRNRAYYSTKGSYLSARAEYVIPVSNNWTKDLFNNSFIVYAKWNGNLPLGKRKKFTFQPGLFAGFTVNAKNSNLPPLNHWFGLGGLNNFNYQNTIVPFMGTKFIQLWGLHSVVARLGLQYNIYKKVYLIARDDIGTVWGLEEKGDKTDDLDLDLINGYGLTVGYDSFIGPAELTFMGSNIYGFSVFLSVGFWF